MPAPTHIPRYAGPRTPECAAAEELYNERLIDPRPDANAIADALRAVVATHLRSYPAGINRLHPRKS